MKIKKYLLIILCFLGIFFVFSPILAETLDIGMEYATGTGLERQDPRVTVIKIINQATLVLGVVFLILIIGSAAVYMKVEDPDKKDKARKIITSAVIGFVIILMAFAITLLLLRMLGVGAYKKGDADGNGRIDEADLQVLIDGVAGRPIECVDQANYAIDCKKVLDIDGDHYLAPGDISALEILIINQ